MKRWLTVSYFCSSFKCFINNLIIYLAHEFSNSIVTNLYFNITWLYSSIFCFLEQHLGRELKFKYSYPLYNTRTHSGPPKLSLQILNKNINFFAFGASPEALEVSGALWVHSHVSVEVARLTEPQEAKFTLVGLFSWMDPKMLGEGGGITESLLTHSTAVGSVPRVCSHVGCHRRRLGEPSFANWAPERFFTAVCTYMGC